MKKYLYVIANYNDNRQELFNKFISPKNKKFCKIHNYEYIEITENLEPFRDNYTWLKFTKIKEWLDNNFLKENDLVLNLDADMSIMKFDTDYPNEKTFSYSIDNGNTHCMGNYSLRINEWSNQMINNLLSEERFNFFKNYRWQSPSATGNHFGFWNDFREQASWYSLCGIKRHSFDSFFNIDNFGWHTELNEKVIYSIEDLQKHVQILKPEWNTTIMYGEGGESNPYFINKTKKEDTIIRHFAGGIPWFKQYLEN